ncbi:hypothetical protein F0160_22705 [Paraburkholderia sp. JPY303]|uniref:hypothetical protein n=1 Tax=Paraburkholderia atlantica TaxID=2654982 RepID=UPI001590F915|nr:hypothetical protein [Paraburkholderia atlantica]NUY33299.1 hypothetical protein [Paraburkholderia atlantica]
MLYGIQRTEIDAVWGEVRPWIEASCRRNRGKYDAEDIKAGLLSGEDQLWIWKSPTAFAVGITRLANYPKQRVCTIRIVTGTNAAEWQRPAMEAIEEWARSNGCNAMELCARAGWSRRMRAQGYEETHRFIEKAL